MEAASITEGRYLSGPVSDSTVVPDVERTREFAVEIDVADLANATASTAAGNATHVSFNRSAPAGTHEVYVYEPADGSAGDVAVATGENGTTPTERCRVEDAAGRVRLDLTGERLDGVPCHGIWPTAVTADGDPYEIGFVDADGRGVEATATVDSDADPTAHDELDRAVYDATIDLRYRTADVRFETTVRVAPGEPDA
ncbi:hypothetical protein [Halorubrum sp. CBA1125]|uniref:hypothetical protein n=1 Tax=Halorubrum sp. CBA1125 TaxID=2668072 RepID=UPI001E537980|nr:hypothetical protein [Halorubrum sp. CBA1125]